MSWITIIAQLVIEVLRLIISKSEEKKASLNNVLNTARTERRQCQGAGCEIDLVEEKK